MPRIEVYASCRDFFFDVNLPHQPGNGKSQNMFATQTQKDPRGDYSWLNTSKEINLSFCLKLSVCDDLCRQVVADKCYPLASARAGWMREGTPCPARHR